MTSHPARRRLALGALGVIGVVGLGAAGCSSEPGSTAAFCDQVDEVPALEAVLARFSETDPAVLQDRIDKARDAYEELAEAAPSKIQSDTAEVVALVDEILVAVEEHPGDPAEAADQLRAAMDEHPDAAAARDRVAAFAEDRCDIVLDPVLTDGLDATTTTSTSAPSGTSTTIPGTFTPTTAGG